MHNLTLLSTTTSGNGTATIGSFVAGTVVTITEQVQTNWTVTTGNPREVTMPDNDHSVKFGNHKDEVLSSWYFVPGCVADNSGRGKVDIWNPGPGNLTNTSAKWSTSFTDLLGTLLPSAMKPAGTSVSNESLENKSVNVTVTATQDGETSSQTTLVGPCPREKPGRYTVYASKVVKTTCALAKEALSYVDPNNDRYNIWQTRFASDDPDNRKSGMLFRDYTCMSEDEVVTLNEGGAIACLSGYQGDIWLGDKDKPFCSISAGDDGTMSNIVWGKIWGEPGGQIGMTFTGLVPGSAWDLLAKNHGFSWNTSVNYGQMGATPMTLIKDLPLARGWRGNNLGEWLNNHTPETNCCEKHEGDSASPISNSAYNGELVGSVTINGRELKLYEATFNANGAMNIPSGDSAALFNGHIRWHAILGIKLEAGMQVTISERGHASNWVIGTKDQHGYSVRLDGTNTTPDIGSCVSPFGGGIISFELIAQ